MTENNLWTTKRLNELKLLIKRGLSTAEISQKLGMSKNAVVGKLNRLGWNSQNLKEVRVFSDLVAVFIINHKSTRGKLYNFSNKYVVDFKEIGNKNEFIIKDIDKSKKIVLEDYSLRVIVGKNGTGKTSIVESLRRESTRSILERNWDDDIDSAIYFCASNSGNFSWYYRGNFDLAKYKCDTIDGKMKNIKKSNFLVSTQRKTQSTIYLIPELMHLYTSYGTPEFFKEEKIDFDYFSFILKESFQSSWDKKINHMLYELFYNNEQFPKRNTYFLYYVLFFQHLYSTSYFRNNPDKGLEGLEGIQKYTELEEWYESTIKKIDLELPKLDDVIEAIDDLLNKLDIDTVLYPSGKIKLLTKSDKLLINFRSNINEMDGNIKFKTSEYMMRLLDKKMSIPFWFPNWILDKLFTIEFLRFNKNTDKFYTYSGLSSGEQAMLGMFAEIFKQLSDIGDKSQNSIVIVLDEPTNSLHPEWQRKFIYYIDQFIKNLSAKHKERIKNIMITTHSPFIVTDVSNDEIIFLQKDNENIKEKDIPNTFAGNIHTLLAKPFFMENGTIGEFARRQISDLVDFYNMSPDKIEKDIDSQIKYEKLLNMMDDSNLIKMVLNNKVKRKNKDANNEEI